MDNKKLKEYISESVIIILVIIAFSFISYRIGVWQGENNIAEKYDIRISDKIRLNSSGEEIRIPFRWFD
jgi:hypothetical protein